VFSLLLSDSNFCSDGQTIIGGRTDENDYHHVGTFRRLWRSVRGGDGGNNAVIGLLSARDTNDGR